MVQIVPPVPDRPYALLLAEGEAHPADVDAATVIDLFKRHGALLLRGFRTGLDDFQTFVGRYCATSVFNESPDRQLLDAEGNIQSVNRGSDPFPLHPELSREPWKPDACFFCCLEPPTAGGETTICDGVEIVRRLPPPLREALAARRLAYIQPASPEMLAFWLGTPRPTPAQLASPPPSCPYRFVAVGDRVVRVFTRPALHQPMFGDEPAFGNFLLFARDYLGLPDFPIFAEGQPVPEPWLAVVRQVAERLTAPVAWEKGDLLMLDNSRFMHGRRAIVDAEERLIASYFGYLRFAPPNPEEPDDPPWRRASFRPPQPRRGATARPA